MVYVYLSGIIVLAVVYAGFLCRFIEGRCPAVGLSLTIGVAVIVMEALFHAVGPDMYVLGSLLVVGSVVLALMPHRHRWRVAPTFWPYDQGYGVYCDGCNTVLCSGFTKEAAQHICDIENARRFEDDG